MLLSILAMFHPVISFAASSVTNAQDAGRAIALGAGAGGGAAGAGAASGDQWLGFALTEACFFYGLVGGFIAFFL
jgi:F-type H+-transporting ATPase subunit c